MYKTGDAVQAMYMDGGNGTVLGPGTVQNVAAKPDGGFRVTVEFPDGKTRGYSVSRNGHSDYLLPA